MLNGIVRERLMKSCRKAHRGLGKLFAGKINRIDCGQNCGQLRSKESWLGDESVCQFIKCFGSINQ